MHRHTKASADRRKTGGKQAEKQPHMLDSAEGTGSGHRWGVQLVRLAGKSACPVARQQQPSLTGCCATGGEQRNQRFSLSSSLSSVLLQTLTTRGRVGVRGQVEQLQNHVSAARAAALAEVHVHAAGLKLRMRMRKATGRTKVRELLRLGTSAGSHDRKCGPGPGRGPGQVGELWDSGGGVRVEEAPHQGSAEPLSCCYGDEGEMTDGGEGCRGVEGRPEASDQHEQLEQKHQQLFQTWA